MKILLREIGWGLIMVAISILVLPVLLIVDWGDIYLYCWKTLRAYNITHSDSSTRLLIITVASIFFTGIFAAIVLISAKVLRNRPALLQRVIQLCFIVSGFFVVELYLQWHGIFPGSLYRNFRLVNSLTNEQSQYSDSMGIIRYVKNPLLHPSDYVINNDGFRSRYEYDSSSVSQLKSKGKKVVMVVGDSFVEGLSAQPITACFADILDTGNIATLNFGQGGTDPLQYLLVCNIYVPLLKPDLVVVCLFSNDFLTYNRTPAPGTPIFYRTNASPNGGMLMTQKPIDLGYKPNELFKNAKEAYNFYTKHYTIRYNNNPLIRFCSYSSILTGIYIKLTHPALPGNEQFQYAANTDSAAQKIMYNYLKQIKDVCTAHNCHVMFCGIPSKTEINAIHNITLHGENDSIHITYPVNLVSADYNQLNDDMHFNNSGHRKYASFLLQTITH
jgi:hypothetical protein